MLVIGLELLKTRQAEAWPRKKSRHCWKPAKPRCTAYSKQLSAGKVT